MRSGDRIAAVLQHLSWRCNLEELLKEVLSFVEGDVRWWDEAAQHVEELARALPESKRTKWNLLAAVYHERAKAHTELVETVRKRSGG
jgi:CHAD domain-containing protein